MPLLAYKCKLRILSPTLAILLICALIAFIFRPSEPAFQGRRLSLWLAKAASNDPNGDQLLAIQTIGTNALPMLVQWLRSVDPDWRQKTFDILEENLPFACRVFAPSQKRSRALAGFEILGTNAMPAIPDLIQLIDDPHCEVRCAAVGAFQWMPRRDPKVIAALDRALHDKEFAVRANSACVLGQVGPGSAKALALLVRSLNDPHPAVVLSAIHALAEFGSAARPVVPVLLSHPNLDPRARRTVVTLLKNIEGAEALSDLARLADDFDPTVRCAALHQAGSFTNNPRAVRLLVDHLRDPNTKCQSVALTTLTQFGPSATEAVPELLALYKQAPDAEITGPSQTQGQQIALALVRIDPLTAQQVGINPKDYEHRMSSGRRRRAPAP